MSGSRRSSGTAASPGAARAKPWDQPRFAQPSAQAFSGCVPRSPTASRKGPVRPELVQLVKGIRAIRLYMTMCRYHVRSWRCQVFLAPGRGHQRHEVGFERDVGGVPREKTLTVCKLFEVWRRRAQRPLATLWRFRWPTRRGRGADEDSR